MSPGAMVWLGREGGKQATPSLGTTLLTDGRLYRHGAHGHVCREAEETDAGPHPRANPWQDDRGGEWLNLRWHGLVGTPGFCPP